MIKMSSFTYKQIQNADEHLTESHRSSRMLTISGSSFSNNATTAASHRGHRQRRNSVRSDPGHYDDDQGNAEVVIPQKKVSCCIAGEHFMTSDQVDNYFTSTSRNSSIGASVINVNISDVMGEDNTVATTAALKRCKTKVLNPYNMLITLIGWRKFRRESASCCFKILNMIYLMVIMALLLVGYTYQTISCSGKLNVRTDIRLVSIRPSMRMTTPTPPANITEAASTGIFGDYSENELTTKKAVNMTKLPTDRDNEGFMDECDHVVTTYVVPAVLHFIAFFYGVLYFRIQENEQLHSLMEKVFLQSQAMMGAQERLIRNCRVFLFGAGCWLIFCLGQEVIFVLAFGHTAILLPKSSSVKYYTLRSYILSAVGILGVMVQQCVNVAIILNYGTQCEMVVLYTRGICLRLHEKSQELRATMHEILGVRDFVSLLNGALARITALCIVICCEMTIIGLCLLVLNRIHSVRVYSYRILFVITWLTALLFPVTQAARLTKVGRRLNHISFEMKVFGYKNASQLELDSFMLFVSNAKLRAKLFSIPISPAVVMGITVTIGITMLLLFQTGVIGKHSYF